MYNEGCRHEFSGLEQDPCCPLLRTLTDEGPGIQKGSRPCSQLTVNGLLALFSLHTPSERRAYADTTVSILLYLVLAIQSLRQPNKQDIQCAWKYGLKTDMEGTLSLTYYAQKNRDAIHFLEASFHPGTTIGPSTLL